MPANPLADIVLAAASLKGTHPQSFQQLCDAVKSYEAQAIVEMIAADGSDLLRVQGKVRSVQQLRKHLVECAELRETYNRRDANART